MDPGHEPYAQLDVRLATKLLGAIWLIAAAYAALVLPLALPEGDAAWVGMGLLGAASITIGVYLLKRRAPAHPDVLYALAFTGVALSVAFRAAAGPGAPFAQFLLLTTLFACAVHPFKRSLAVLAFSTVAAFSPTWFSSVEDTFAATTVADLAYLWSMGLLLVIWMTRVRRNRAAAEAARAQADQLARVDALTGLGNLRALEEALGGAAAGARRHGRPLSLLVSDMDDFKAVNDSHGHAAGDALLRAVAEAFEETVRGADPCFRWGGDEFVALLPDAGLDEARLIAERITAVVAEQVKRPDGRTTGISVGAAELSDADEPLDLLTRADEAQLAVKERRRAAAHQLNLAFDS